MAATIRLKRMGKVRSPHYRVVVADSRAKRDGANIEEIGVYHPVEEPSFIKINSERAQYGLSVGAQPSDRVRSLLKVTGDWQKFKGLRGAEGTLRTKPEAEAFVAPATATVINDKPEEKASEEKTEVLADESAPEQAEAEEKPEA